MVEIDWSSLVVTDALTGNDVARRAVRGYPSEAHTFVKGSELMTVSCYRY